MGQVHAAGEPGRAGAVLEKNRELYDDTSSPIWRLAVYQGTHDGWEFINMGGRELLDAMIDGSGLTAGMHALELCCGRGATCRYLAERCRCSVTGVELNANQLRRASRMRKRAPEELRCRLRFVRGDVQRFRPGRGYDAVLSIDSLMLIDDLPAVLETARSALAPGGRLEIAVIAAGERISAEMRRFAWEVDGMISLPSAAEYRRLLEAATFVDVEIEDLSRLAVDFSRRLSLSIDARRAELAESLDEAELRGWLEVGAIYEAAFEDRRLSYLHLRGAAS